jgi:hypothetical protein
LRRCRENRFQVSEVGVLGWLGKPKLLLTET